MYVKCFGITISDCEDCEVLKSSLIRSFKKYNISLYFEEIIYDEDPTLSVNIAEKFGVVNIPAFIILKEIFYLNFSESQVEKVVKKINEK